MSRFGFFGAALALSGVAFAWFAMLGQSFAQAPVMLTLDWPVGETVKREVRVISTSTTRNPLFPGPLKQSFDQTVHLTINPERHPKGDGKVLQISYDALVCEQTVGRNTVRFDSSTDMEDERHPMKELQGLLGAKSLVLADSLGRVSVPPNFESQMRPFLQGKKVLRLILSESGIKENLNASGSHLIPHKAVAAGAEWDFSWEEVLPGLTTIALDGTVTFRGMEIKEKINCARLDFSGEVTDGKGEKADAPFELKVKLGSYRGTIWLDPTRNVEVASRSRRHLELDMVTGPKEAPVSIIMETIADHRRLAPTP